MFIEKQNANKFTEGHSMINVVKPKCFKTSNSLNHPLP